MNKKVTIAAPMSFEGSLVHTQNWFWYGKTSEYRMAIGWWAVGFTLMLWWTLILMWYMTWGILLIPYRIIRRSSRKSKLQNRQHREVIEALSKRDAP